MDRSAVRSRFTSTLSTLVTTVAALCLMLAALPVAAQDDDSGSLRLTYNHLQQNRNVAFPTQKLKDGETLVLEIVDTCPSSFDYALEKLPLLAPPPRTTATAVCERGTAEVEIVHSKAFGGYVVHVSHTPGTVRTLDGTELADVDITIPVDTAKWDIDIQGGFTFSGLTSPQFAIVDEIGDDGMATGNQMVIEDSDAEDDVELGIAGFIHLRHPKYENWVPLTFGLGINEGNSSDATYYAGMGYRFNDKAALTGGLAFGSVDRLPTGVDPGDLTDDANLLGRLGTKTETSFFIAITYKFITLGDLFQKPFAGGDQAQPATRVQRETEGAEEEGEEEAEEEAEEEEAEEETEEETGDAAALPAPGAPRVSAVAGGVKLEWDAVEGATHYIVLGSTLPCQPAELEVVDEGTSFEKTDLLPNTTWCFQVQAENDGSTSEASPAVEFTFSGGS